MIDKTEEKINANRINVDDKEYINNKSDFSTIMKNELKKMAAEGYTFAKLPKCYLVPQLQDWIMHRKGVVFSKMDKENLMRMSRAVWNTTIIHKAAHIKKPSLHMKKSDLKKLTYDQANWMKKKIKKIKEVFYSEVRKARVSYARIMWNTMEHGKFPSTSFKKAFFTYMSSKEADGHVYRP
ncbi:uncharacterized protein [Cardiocondyla obscurior]|uniref:uncharacterized protein n=1 Tax=Cardiocondyla obscurior TaxID=286306 RepID=UPI0039655D20